ncbi:HAE1 family hydrophobic/amphiphilic exporter-1 [Desulfofundulus luciae]|uniref:HAE1 family hydrophobic/amphiphilic exporter-1 n=1 Tax=Desulfofundulus luciae TaxID=74702 RepID=A0ABU0AX77_9FIRM|nr:efflux RND transporter permease subunit [Desulfofundulus luciae]MDQ0285075.1 HAE1 family hydrophobic/amphiphilic exporter-1 [Desulfofundulus luciae]
MKITDISIKRPMLVAVLVTVALILGGVSLSRLTIDLFPDLDLPVGAVITTCEGVAPEEIENQITKPLESVLSTVNNLDSISSTSSMGRSVVIVRFKWGTDMDYASLQMREKVDIIRRSLPEDADDPLILRMDPNMFPIIQLSLASNDPARLKDLADDVIQPRLERVAGVASVWTAGGYEREIRVFVDPVKLQGYGLALNQLTAALRAENMNVSSGTAREGTMDYLIRVTGEFKNLDEIRQVVIDSPGGTPIHIGDVARVVDGQKKVTQLSRVNGEPAMAMYINKQSDANTVQVARAVKKAIARLERDLPEVQFRIVDDQSKFIQQSINHVVREIVVGGILAVLIIWIFLRNLRSTLIISTAIPISIIITFVLLYFCDMTLNLITMGGLALGVGLIVDDAIVVLENIYRHRQQGLGMVDAARVATDEVGGAVIASTLTPIAVFLPVIFVQGLAAQLFTPMALTVSFSIFASLMVALTLVPLLASRMLVLETAGEGEVRGWRRIYRLSERWFNNLDAAYRRLLSWALGHRRRVILTVAAGLVLSVLAIPLVGLELMPRMDQGKINITIEMPKGTALDETNRVCTEIEKIAGAMPEVKSIATGVGYTGSRMSGGTTDTAQISLELVDRAERKLSADQLAEKLRRELKSIPGAEIKVSAPTSSFAQGNFIQGSGTAPVDVRIIGDDLYELTRLGEQLASLVRQVPGTRQVTSSLEEGRPEVQVHVHRDRAAMYWLTPAEVASTVRTAIDGVVATRYRVGGDEIDIRVELDTADSTRLQDLNHLEIMSPAGTKIPLTQVADLVLARGPNEIQREDQSRIVSVTAELAGRDLGSVIRDIRARLPELDLPPGYLIDFAGEQEQMQETFSALGLALILAVVLVYLVMVAQFESLLQPFIIMFSVPVTLIGIVFSLLVTGRSFSLPAFIGVIMLVGIVVKNTIVLIDYVNKLRSRGMSREEAILKAGPTRLRPILMTALTAILAMFPMALGLGEGSEAQAPMATVVIGGLAFSTLITLVLVPVVYTLLEDRLARWRNRRAGKRGVELEAGAGH